MLLARLICSDPACAESVETTGASLAELATLLCDCGYGLEVLALSHVEVVAPRARAERHLRLALAVEPVAPPAERAAA